MESSKTLLDRLSDRRQAEAFYNLFPDNEHREAVIHTCKAGRAVVKDCRLLGRMHPEIEELVF